MKTKLIATFVALVITTAAQFATAQDIRRSSPPAPEPSAQKQDSGDATKALIAQQCELAKQHNDTANESAFKEALLVIEGKTASLSSDARNRIAIARNNANSNNHPEIGAAWEFVLTKGGIMTTSTTTVNTTGMSSFQGTGKDVDRCNYMLNRGPRSGHVCGRSKAEHVHIGDFFFCPDNICANCGKSPQVHFWEDGNGLICNIRRNQEVVGMMAQANLPAIIVVGTREVADAPPPPVEVKRKLVVTVPPVVTPPVVRTTATTVVTTKKATPKPCKTRTSVAPVAAK